MQEEEEIPAAPAQGAACSSSSSDAVVTPELPHSLRMQEFDYSSGLLAKKFTLRAQVKLPAQCTKSISKA